VADSAAIGAVAEADDSADRSRPHIVRSRHGVKHRGGTVTHFAPRTLCFPEHVMSIWGGELGAAPHACAHELRVKCFEHIVRVELHERGECMELRMVLSVDVPRVQENGLQL
jgi:hypothetical protein